MAKVVGIGKQRFDKILEKSLEETVQAALKQIKEKKYDTELLKAGVKKECIRHYGFAFEGKRVLIGGNEHR